MATKEEKIRPNEWYRIGAETKVLVDLIVNYRRMLEKKFGTSHPFAQKAMTISKKMGNLQCEMDDVVPPIAGQDSVFYTDMMEEQKHMAKRFAKSYRK